MTLPRFLQFITHRGGKSAGAIRVSLGHRQQLRRRRSASCEFAAAFRDQTRLTIGDVTFDIESCRVIRDGARTRTAFTLLGSQFTVRVQVRFRLTFRFGFARTRTSSVERTELEHEPSSENPEA